MIQKKSLFKFTIIPVVFILLLSTCNSNRVYHKVYTFENYQWSSKKKLLYYPEFGVTDINLPYDFIINLRYITGFPYKYLNIKLKITRPDGTEASKKIGIQIANDSKEYQGDGAGDYWDIDYKVQEAIEFNQVAPGSP